MGKFRGGWVGAAGILLLCAGVGCSKSNKQNCGTLSGTSWSPQTNAIGTIHDSSVQVTHAALDASGVLTGLAQPAPASRETAVTFSLNEDLGTGGSLTLVAQMTSKPPTMKGNAWPILVSLSDGVHEFVNLARDGHGQDCASAGYYACSGDTCVPNPGCTIKAPSAYASRDQWEQHSSGVTDSAFNTPTIYTFPTCNWTGGSDDSLYPACSFINSFLDPSTNSLKRGTYTARYLVMSDTYDTVDGIVVPFTVNVFKKVNKSAPSVLDVNVVLVGSSNIQSSRTAKGQQNLNTMVDTLARYYSQADLKIGKVTAVEWTCQAGGDDYANIAANDLPAMFAAGKSVLPPETEGKAVNVYLVSTILNGNTGLNPNLTILGVDGAIGGSPINGTSQSGLAVSTFDQLAKFNSRCPDGAPVCPQNTQDASFFEIGETVAHEVGHFLGLNHLSEFDGSRHDALSDTPVCTTPESIAGGRFITIYSCLKLDRNVFPSSERSCQSSCPGYSPLAASFCPQSVECEFNHLMWWTIKNFDEKTGLADGDILTPESAAVIRYSPLVQ